MRRIVRIAGVALLLYVGAYVDFRQTHTEFWERDKRAYVIFPESYGRPLYYAWRPLHFWTRPSPGCSTTSGHIGEGRIPRFS